MNEIRPRIMGTELEWNLLLLQGDEAVYPTNHSNIPNEVIDHVPRELILKKSMLRNGARIYNDCGLVEYATGEEDSIDGLAASEIAGERVVYHAAETYALEQGYDGFVLRKRVEGRDGNFNRNVSGYHINLSSEARLAENMPEHLRLLGFWAATASLYTGAGKLQTVTDAEGVASQHFTIAQKSALSKTGFARSKMFDKPLVALSTAAHAAQHLYSRIEIAGIDQNTSPWAIRMAAGTASLVLRAIEQGYDDHIELALNDSALVSTARSVALHGIDAVVHSDSDYTIPAIDLQYEIAELASKTEHTQEEAHILSDWFEVLDSLSARKGPPLDQIGWVQRKQRLTAYAAEHGLSLASRELLLFDRTLDEIGKKSTAQTLRESTWAAHMPDSHLIEHRLTNPCPTTRAAQRVAMADSYGPTLLDVDWSMLRVSTSTDPAHCETANILLNDPYDNTVTK